MITNVWRFINRRIEDQIMEIREELDFIKWNRLWENVKIGKFIVIIIIDFFSLILLSCNDEEYTCCIHVENKFEY